MAIDIFGERTQEQFNKTLESLDSKLNRLKNAWNEFTMGLANNKGINEKICNKKEIKKS